MCIRDSSPVVLSRRPSAADRAVAQPVELRRVLPVLPRQLERVLDAHPTLLGAVDEEEPTKGPVGLATEVFPRLLLDDDDPLARGCQLCLLYTSRCV